jgi:YVTN family beta-propeller protein
MNTLNRALATLGLITLAGVAGSAQTVSKLVVSPSPAFAIAGGVPLQLHAIATYTNAATQDVTSSAVWVSDNLTVATVNAGLASGLTLGTANLTATFGGRTAPAVLNVEGFSPGLPAAVATVPVGGKPIAIGLNPITGMIYIANSATNNVSVVDGTSLATTAIPAGVSPSGIAVNPVTNRIYVANSGSNNVTVIDGQTNATATVPAGTSPQAIALDAVTNKIYVANADSITVIDGQTNAAATIPGLPALISIAVNPVTNRIYAGYFATRPASSSSMAPPTRNSPSLPYLEDLSRSRLPSTPSPTRSTPPRHCRD